MNSAYIKLQDTKRNFNALDLLEITAALLTVISLFCFSEMHMLWGFIVGMLSNAAWFIWASIKDALFLQLLQVALLMITINGLIGVML